MDAASVKKISLASSIRSSLRGPEERDLAFPPCAALHGRMAAASRSHLHWVKVRSLRFTFRETNGNNFLPTAWSLAACLAAASAQRRLLLPASQNDGASSRLCS